MTQQKKTIQLPNGLAEEGDRVSRPEQWESGYLMFKDNGSPIFRSDDDIEHLLSDQEEDSDFGYLWSGELMFSFSPTDAIEAVEEERCEINKMQALPHNMKGIVNSSLNSLIERINQKRKGQ